MDYQIFRRRLLFQSMLTGIACVCLFGCAGSESTSEITSKTNNEFDDRLLEIAGEYIEYGRVDDQTRWAPMMCNIPSPAIGRFSASADDQTHGQKLYFMFARNRDNYLSAGKFDQPVGQVIVKQSWSHKATPAERPPSDQFDRVTEDLKLTSDQQTDLLAAKTQSYLPYAEKDGSWYQTEDQKELFLMMKVEDAKDLTDNGWVYGVVSSDGKSVIDSGRIQSCMDCHTKAPRDRIFGLPN